MPTLRENLLSRTRTGELYEKKADQLVQCFACGHRCKIPVGRDGICKVRSNVGGELKVPWGYVAGLQVDPIEKKPFFHVFPGADALSFGMLGCDFHCAYCQNWFTSQALRDPKATADAKDVEVKEIISLAKKSGAKVLTSTYNEPLITSEWAVEIFKGAKREGFLTSYVSNGNGTKEVLDYIRPHVDLYKIDLKGFRDKSYRELGGVLKNVTDTIQNVHRMGFWLEIVTLVIPGFNDSQEELKDMAQFIKSVSPDIPWHLTAYHRDYKMSDHEDTSVSDLVRAGEMAKSLGIRHVYLGNRPGQVGNWENSYCHECQELLIARRGYHILENRLEDSRCPSCRTSFPGVFPVSDALKTSEPDNYLAKSSVSQ